MKDTSNCTHKLSKKTDRNRQLLRRKSDWNWTEREEEDSNELTKKITEILCLAPFASDRDNIVWTDESRTGLGMTVWRNQNDDTFRPIPSTSWNLNDAEKYSVGELELHAVLWGLRKFRFYLCSMLVQFYTNPLALEQLIERTRAYWQNNARLIWWLDKLACFGISQKHTAREKLVLTDYLSRPATKEATADETHDEEIVINILSELATTPYVRTILEDRPKISINRLITKLDIKSGPRIKRWDWFDGKIRIGRQFNRLHVRTSTGN